jgi:type IV pilus assembly protein PilA
MKSIVAAIQRRTQDEREAGFSLIELAVVLIIIGILLAIAIPTFLGQRTRSQNTQSDSSLRNSLSSARVLMTDTGVYDTTANMVTALGTSAPEFTFVAQAAAANQSAGPNDIVVEVNAGVLTLQSRAASGECREITDDPSSGTTGVVTTTAADAC